MEQIHLFLKRGVIMENVLKLINTEPFDVCKFQSAVKNMNEVDIAEMLDTLSKEKAVQVFRLLPKGIATEVFANIESDEQQIIVEALTDSEVGEIINRLFVDDAVDFIEEMPANVVKRVLVSVSDEKRKIINQMLQYPEDSAGSVMTTEYVDLMEGLTVSEAFAYIRATGVHKETIYTSYVIKRDRLLVGIVSAKDLMLAQPDQKIEDIMDSNFIRVHTTDDQEMVAAIFKKYDLLSMPVVDKEERLVGIITVDDVVDIIEEENTEDFEIMGALSPSEDPYLKTNIFSLAKNRIVWLLVLMLSATVTGAIISGFEDALALLPVLVAFIPMLMDTGGNAGSQSSTLIIRGMALGEINPKDMLRVLWKEIRIGLMCSLALGFINFIRIYLTNGKNVALAFAVTASLCVTVVIAKSVGCVLPMLAKKAHIDPAIMAAPLITTIVDAASLIVYFSIARMIFQL
ncbi:MAG: magnesium transporter [Treponema sp.]|jgi:magnesium transporter|nr:magnesium transporter [Treponema sp.]